MNLRNRKSNQQDWVIVSGGRVQPGRGKFCDNSQFHTYIIESSALKKGRKYSEDNELMGPINH